MKLTHVILYYPSMEKGGIEVNIRHLVKYLTNKGIKITLISNEELTAELYAYSVLQNYVALEGYLTTV